MNLHAQENSVNNLLIMIYVSILTIMCACGDVSTILLVDCIKNTWPETEHVLFWEETANSNSGLKK